MATRKLDVEAMRDREWRGYHPRAAIPTVVVASLVSLTLLVGRWVFSDFEILDSHVSAFVFYALAIVIWPVLLLSLIYRMITYTFRLTNRGMLVDWGFRHLPEPPLLFGELLTVEVAVSRLDRLLGLGKLQLRCQSGRVVLLKGVREPEGFASAIRTAQAEFKARTP